jgi:hypothetical protein
MHTQMHTQKKKPGNFEEGWRYLKLVIVQWMGKARNASEVGELTCSKW